MIDSRAWKVWAARAVSAAHSLLAPRRMECLLCKQAAMIDGDRMGLCRVCFSSVPWIRDVRCDVCGRGENCPDCARRRERSFMRSRSAVRYDDLMKELLARYKYRGDEKLRSVFGPMLKYPYERLQEGLANLGEEYREAKPLITFVPVSERRLLERGFNQAEQMAVELGAAVGVPVVPLLRRVKHTDKQSFKKRSERIEGLHNVFEIDSEAEERVKAAAGLEAGISRVIVYVVDDVYTTGSTMNQCAKVIKDALPATVLGITWAR